MSSPFANLVRMVLFVGIASVVGCDTGPSKPGDVIFPDSNVSYRQHVQPLFDVGCNVNGCHNEFDRAGNISLETYFHVISRPGLVIPEDSSSSLLVQVIRGRQPHPVTISSYVNDRQARGVAIWVQEGARNN